MARRDADKAADNKDILEGSEAIPSTVIKQATEDQAETAKLRSAGSQKLDKILDANVA